MLGKRFARHTQVTAPAEVGELLEIPAEIDRALSLIASTGDTLTRACRKAGCETGDMWDWVKLATRHAEIFTRAREIGTHVLADQIRDIAEGVDELGGIADQLAGWATMQLNERDAREFLNRFTNARVSRDAMRINALKWEARVRLPKVYGDKVDITSGGEAIRPAVVNLPALAARPTPPEDGDGFTVTETRTVTAQGRGLALAAALERARARSAGSTKPEHADALLEGIPPALEPGNGNGNGNGHNGG